MNDILKGKCRHCYMSLPCTLEQEHTHTHTHTHTHSPISHKGDETHTHTHTLFINEHVHINKWGKLPKLALLDLVKSQIDNLYFVISRICSVQLLWFAKIITTDVIKKSNVFLYWSKAAKKSAEN